MHRYRTPIAIIAQRLAASIVLLFASTLPLSAAEIKKETIQAWDRYMQWAQQKATRNLSDPNVFLLQNTLPPKERTEIRQSLDRGDVVARRMPSILPKGVSFEVPSGEIHHWWGAVLLRNVTLERLMSFLQDYDHHAGKFSDVERSKLLSKSGDRYRFYFRLRRSKAMVTVHYNTEQECIYTVNGPTRVSSQSEALKIAELADAGTPEEREKKPGDDSGFLWRLVSWWRFEQRGPDVLIELESASLSRDIPAYIRFLPGISSYIRSTPRESLESVLTSIRSSMK